MNNFIVNYERILEVLRKISEDTLLSYQGIFVEVLGYNDYKQ